MNKILFAITASLFFTGCVKEDFSNKDYLVAKEIIKNRTQYKSEILIATNECIKNANTLTSLAAAGNDAAETIEECSNQAQKAYGAYSPWYEDYLLRQAYAQ